MKRKHIILILILVVGVLWLLRPGKRDALDVAPADSRAARSGESALQGNKITNSNESGLTYVNREAEKDAASGLQRARERSIERYYDEWRTPIEFYGKVVDETGQPVPDVDVTMGVTDLSSEGHTAYQTKSDRNGLFSLQGIQGKHLSVQLHKAGYYVSRSNQVSFFYAGENENFIPNRLHPVTFHLRKHGQAEPLIVWNTIHNVSISGKPLDLDSRTGKAVPPGTGNVVVEYVKGTQHPSQGKRYDWSFRVSVPGGGLRISTNEFDFVAPQTGYQLEDAIITRASDESWEARMNRNYFLILSDGNFARVTFDLMAHNGSLRIQAFLNPRGSPNLEYNETARP